MGDATAPLPTWEIQVFGAFRITREGEPVLSLGSVPIRALKFLAVTPHAIHVERLIEVLWPGAARDVGRTRLRNVIARIRFACGEIVQRRGDLVELADGVDVDLWRFEASAVHALTSMRRDPEGAERTARQVLALARRDLLPADIYADWAQPTRDHVARLIESLMDQFVPHRRTLHHVPLSLTS